MGFFDKLFGPKRDPRKMADLANLAGFAVTQMIDRLFDDPSAAPMTLQMHQPEDELLAELVANADAAKVWLERNANGASLLAAAWTLLEDDQHWVVVNTRDPGGGVSVEVRCSYHPATETTPLMMGNRLQLSDTYGDPEILQASKDVVLEAIGKGSRGKKWKVRETESERAWNELVASAMPLLHALSARLPLPDPAGRFDFSQDTGKFTMRDASGTITVEARFVPVGTWSSNTNSWFWSWANETVDRALVEPLQKLRAYGGMRELESLTAPRVPCTMDEAGQIYAVALQVLEAHGWYRAQISPTSWIHTALFDIQLAPGVKAPVN